MSLTKINSQSKKQSFVLLEMAFLDVGNHSSSSQVWDWRIFIPLCFTKVKMCRTICSYNPASITCGYRMHKIVSTTLKQVGQARYRIVIITLIQVEHAHYRIVSQGPPIKSRAQEHFSVLKPPRANRFKASTSSPFLQWKFKQGWFGPVIFAALCRACLFLGGPAPQELARGEEGGEKEGQGGDRRRRRRSTQDKTPLITSNNPHLAGREQP